MANKTIALLLLLAVAANSQQLQLISRESMNFEISLGYVLAITLCIFLIIV